MIALVWVKKIAEPLAQAQGLEILLLEERVEHGQRVFRIYLDSPQGISLEDCANFSHLLDPLLEAETELTGAFNLEVSSPGLNRTLAKAEHFQAQLGKIVQISTHEEIQGRRKFKGILEKFVEEASEPTIQVLLEGKTFSIPLSQIKKAHLDYFASEELIRKKGKVENATS